MVCLISKSKASLHCALLSLRVIHPQHKKKVFPIFGCKQINQLSDYSEFIITTTTKTQNTKTTNKQKKTKHKHKTKQKNPPKQTSHKLCFIKSRLKMSHFSFMNSSIEEMLPKKDQLLHILN